MDKAFYYLFTLLESALSVVGIRATYEQPRYAVVGQLDRGVEIRAYDARMAVEGRAPRGRECWSQFTTVRCSQVEQSG